MLVEIPIFISTQHSQLTIGMVKMKAYWT